MKRVTKRIGFSFIIFFLKENGRQTKWHEQRNRKREDMRRHKSKESSWRRLKRLSEEYISWPSRWQASC